MKLVPLRRLLVVGLLLLATVPAVLVAWMLTRSSLQAAEDLAGGILTNVAARVQLGAEAHLRHAHDALNGLLPETMGDAQRARAQQWLRDPAAFENMAFALTRQSTAVPHVYYGTRRGEFFGVEATPAGARVTRRGASGGGRTSVEVTRPGERTAKAAVEAGSFEPRMRSWYQGAMQAKDRVFSPAQPLPGQRQLFVTLSQPVYEDDGSAAGVFGVDLHLKELADLLQTQRISARGAAFVVDEAGLLVAGSAGDPLLRDVAGRLERRGPADSANAAIRQGYAALLAARARQSEDSVAADTSLQRLPMDGDVLLMLQRPFGEALGLRWTLVVAAPESDFTGGIRRTAVASLAAIAGLVLLAALLAFAGAHGLARRLRRLADAAQQIGRGQVPAVDTATRIREVRELSEVLHDSAGQLQAFRRRVEADAAALQEANDTLEARVAARTAELAASREEALAAARAKAAFLATMSHEIRTPLNGVVGMSTLLAETPLDAEQRDYLQTIRVSSDQLLSVINDILDFSKIESGKLDLELEPVALRAAVEEACDIAAPRAREKGLELIIDIPEEGPDAVPQAIVGDVTRIRQVLINLINNAVKFTEHGEVAVHVRRLDADAAGGAELEFRITDTGIGIPPDRVGALFEAFTQVDASTTRRYGGTGLGLAICKRLVALMGGRIGVESTPGAGSTFWFTIRAQPTDLAPPYNPADAGHLEGKRVLVVDDHATNVRVLARQLQLWGLAVGTADSAPAALEWLRQAQEPPHAIITDMHMPGMDGVAFAQAVKAQPQWQGVPLVLLSSGFMPAGDENARLFVARLLKPARQGQLFETLLRCLHGDAPAVSTPAPRERKERTVLVADDNAVNLKVAAAMLGKLGYEVRTARDGREAVQAAADAAAHGPRLAAILMDVNMPDVDGLEATRQIQSVLGAHAPPIIAVTAAASAEDRQRCEAAGMDDYLTKPLQVNALALALEKWTAERAPDPAAPHAHVIPGPAPESAEASLLDLARLEEFREYDDAALTMTREVVGLFLDDLPGRINAMEAAAESPDAAALATAAHALKGAAGNVGAAALHALAGALEEAAAATFPADAAVRVAALRDVSRSTQEALRAWVAQLPPA